MQIHLKEKHTNLLEIQVIIGYHLQDITGELSELMVMVRYELSMMGQVLMQMETLVQIVKLEQVPTII